MCLLFHLHFPGEMRDNKAEFMWSGDCRHDVARIPSLIDHEHDFVTAGIADMSAELQKMIS